MALLILTTSGGRDGFEGLIFPRALRRMRQGGGDQRDPRSMASAGWWPRTARRPPEDRRSWVAWR